LKVYHHRQSLQKHLRNRPEHNDSADRNLGIQCKEKCCEFSCRYITQLRKHLLQKHNFELDIVKRKFTSITGIFHYIIIT
jgi:hypothetical protein